MPKNINQFPSDGKKMLAALEKNLKLAMSKSAAAIETHYRGSFRNQGFADGSAKWKGRHKDKDEGRAILVQSGDLRRSVKTEVVGKSILLSTDVPYAQIHNEGGTIATTQSVRGHKRKTRKGNTDVSAHTRNVNTKMPQRQFMPIQGKDKISPALEDKIYNIVKTSLETAIPT